LIACLTAVSAPLGGQVAGDPAATVAAPAPDGPHLRLLELVDAEGSVKVSYVLEQAFDERIRAKLDAGLEVAFRHSIRVQRRRTLWFDRTLAEKKIVTSAILDTLTRQFTLRREINGGIVETLTTADGDEMRNFMTRVLHVQMALPSDLPRDERVEVRARTQIETRFFLFFPYEFDTGWARWPLAGATDGEAT
jgi:hypothetical protein